MTEEIPEYLGRESVKEKLWRNLDVGTRREKNRYWMKGEERRCRMWYE
jgi:hypothetical protein